jgi:hypothetical protein
MCHNINSFFVVPTCHCRCATTVAAHSYFTPVGTAFMVPAVPVLLPRPSTVTVPVCVPVHVPMVCIAVFFQACMCSNNFPIVPRRPCDKSRCRIYCVQEIDVTYIHSYIQHIPSYPSAPTTISTTFTVCLTEVPWALDTKSPSTDDISVLSPLKLTSTFSSPFYSPTLPP